MAQPVLPPPIRLPGQSAVTTTRPAQAADPAKIAKAAREFEAMAVGEMLKPMFDTTGPANAVTGGGAGEDAWKPMLVQEFAKQIEARGGLGLAGPISDAMMRASGKAAQ